MDHPNSHCCPTSWDQRIPNEPLFDRNFLIDRPPVIPQGFPQSSGECLWNNDPWLLMNQKAEKEAMSYWYNHTVSERTKGVNAQKPAQKSLKHMTTKYPDRPWLHSIDKNINKESQLSNRNYYNPKDCIIPCVKHDIDGFNREADQTFLQTMNNNLKLNCGTRIWNQPTSMKMTEPLDHDHQSYINRCTGMDQRRREVLNSNVISED